MIRQITEEDLPILKSWFEHYPEWPMPTRAMLPANGLGGAIIDDMCAAWLFFSNSGFSMIEFAIADPEYREDDRTEKITELLDYLTGKAKEGGAHVCIAWIKNKNLIENYKGAGFIHGGDCVELIKPL